ncbi:hypothetical protein HJC99_04385 [Candidatus Saccharibacteria bacterium]|nr:hypothetical protein [Candidatus Saccharibacteria bacterium]
MVKKPPAQLGDVSINKDQQRYGSLLMFPGVLKAKLGSTQSAAAMFSDLWTNDAKTLYCRSDNIAPCNTQNLESYSLYVYKVASTNAAAAFKEIGAYLCSPIFTGPLKVPTVACGSEIASDAFRQVLLYTPHQVFAIVGHGRFAKQFADSFRFLS